MPQTIRKKKPAPMQVGQAMAGAIVGADPGGELELEPEPSPISKAFAAVGKVTTAIGKGLSEPGVPEMLAKMGIAFGTSPSGVPGAGARVAEQFIQAGQARRDVEERQALLKLAKERTAATTIAAETGVAREERLAGEKPERKSAKDVEGRLRYMDTGELVFPEVEPTTAGRETAKDVAGRLRFVDTQELVFPEVEPPVETYAPEILMDRIKARLAAKIKADKIDPWEPAEEEALIQDLIEHRRVTGEFYSLPGETGERAIYSFYFLRYKALGWSDEEAKTRAISNMKLDLKY